jgi:hypothetical protein
MDIERVLGLHIYYSDKPELARISIERANRK